MSTRDELGLASTDRDWPAALEGRNFTRVSISGRRIGAGSITLTFACSVFFWRSASWVRRSTSPRKTRSGSTSTTTSHDEGDANVEDDDAWEGSGGEDDDMEDGEAWRSNIRRRGESAEEKRARKAAVKQGRRDARAAKKGLKTTFKREEREMGKKQMVGDVRPGLSVTQLG